jgi:hypothetical protein
MAGYMNLFGFCLEWHKWRVSLPGIERLLASQGLTLHKILHEEENPGTATFIRSGA